MKNYSPDSRRVTCDLGPSFIVIRRNDETNVYKLKALCLLKIGKLAFLVCCAGGGGQVVPINQQDYFHSFKVPSMLKYRVYSIYQRCRPFQKRVSYVFLSNVHFRFVCILVSMELILQSTGAFYFFIRDK